MPSRKHHVLVIDDDEAVSKYAALHLRRQHYRVSRAADGRTGLAIAGRELPDVIVLDHYLPDMTGEDVLLTLRADDRTRQLPVIYLTIDGSRQRFRTSMTRGADDFLSKPFQPVELTDAVAAQLRKHFARMIPHMGEPQRGDAEVARLSEKLHEVEEQLAQAWKERWEALWEAKRIKAKVEHIVAERTQRLESVNDSLANYGHSLAHELKAPLRGIVGYAGILLDEHARELGSDGVGLLHRIDETGRRMNEFIDALMTLAGLRQGGIHRATVDMSTLASEVAAPLLASAPGPLPTLCIAPDMLVQADPILLRVVLENLLSNAVKYSSRTATPHIEVGQLAAAAVATWFVRDNGAGFDMAHAERLFQPFQRLHAARDFSGLGIGLSTVQQIISRHGGRIWCDAIPGSGATFFFTLSEA
jgi:signal transduction histidine kinase